MTDLFFEELKIRHADAQKRMQQAQIETQQAQTKFQTVAQEFNSLTLLLNVELAKQKTIAAAEESSQGTAPAPEGSSTQPPLAQSEPAAEIGKTDMIRQLLSQNPGGLTPTEIWKHVKTRMSHRAYLYSVLKRLKDKGEIIQRRGKYIAKIMPIKPEEEKDQNLVA